MSAQPSRGYLGISEVLAQLRADFPDISVSKIRFLETEGLISPARSPAGYRRFGAVDVDRLRYILTAQRDQYLPLRVIRERLDRLAGGENLEAQPGGPNRHQPGHGVSTLPAASAAVSGSAGTGSAGTGSRGTGSAGTGQAATGPDEPAADQLLSRRELLDAAGMSDALLTELETFGLLRRVGRQYSRDALQVGRTAVALAAYGVEARHLRAVRAAAERETAMIESLVAPILRQRGSGARELASRTASELAGLVLGLHAALVDGTLAEAGLTPPGQQPSSLAQAGLAATSLEGAAAHGGLARPGLIRRGAEGASA
ncbi:MAG TPA: MerR family transcriptional regulator [Streptosporangiaceae bacterium]|jgi:DNA-binding transcriptional MerR regulator